MSDIKYGCVRFEDPHQHNTGWASISGEKPFRIKGTESLPSDVVYIVNLERNLMYQCGFKAHGKYRSSEYLSLKFVNREVSPAIKEKSSIDWIPHSLMATLGVHEDEWREQVKVMSDFFSRVMTISEKLIGIDTPPLYSIDYGVRQRVLPCDPVMERGLVKAINEATVHYVQCEVNTDIYTSGFRRFTVSLPKVKHALSILDTPIPFGEWEIIEKRNLPSKKESIFEWLESVGGCVLARVSMSNIDSTLNRLINFGSGQTYRRWVTTEELVWLSELGDVRITQAYKCSDIGSLKAVEKIKETISKKKDIADLSISLGLFLESFWLGVSKDLAPPVHVLQDKYSANIIRPFYKTKDLMGCLNAAVKLHSKGVHVVGYGKGNIHFLTEKTDDEIAKICSEVEVIPSSMNLKDTSFLNLEKPLDVLLGMILKNESKMLIDTDKAVINNICE